MAHLQFLIIYIRTYMYTYKVITRFFVGCATTPSNLSESWGIINNFSNIKIHECMMMTFLRTKIRPRQRFQQNIPARYLMAA